MKTYMCKTCKREQELRNVVHFEHEPDCKKIDIERVWKFNGSIVIRGVK